MLDSSLGSAAISHGEQYQTLPQTSANLKGPGFPLSAWAGKSAGLKTLSRFFQPVSHRQLCFTRSSQGTTQHTAVGALDARLAGLLFLH